MSDLITHVFAVFTIVNKHTQLNVIMPRTFVCRIELRAYCLERKRK